jgi:hypothetical protein
METSFDKESGTFQVSFLIHSVRGEHIDAQAVVVSVEKETFLLEPKAVRQPRFGDKLPPAHYYKAGYTTYVECDDEIHFSVGIVTPNAKRKFYLHTFTYLNFKPTAYPTLQKLVMTTPAQSYEISVSLFTTPAAPSKMALSPKRTLSKTGTLRSSYQSPSSRLANTYGGRSSSRKSLRNSSTLWYPQ